jgi:hypothetical protein
MQNITTKSNLIRLIASLAIAIGAGSLQPANAQNYQDEAPEIGWSSKLSSMGLDKADNVGKTYSFYCQPAAEDSPHAPIWGTNIYTVNSGICTTAVHSGRISQTGGTVSVELLPGREFYTGSSKNTVTSKDHRKTDFSYTFVGEAMANNSQDSRDRQPQGSSNIKKVIVNSVQKGVERSIERAIVDLFN